MELDGSNACDGVHRSWALVSQFFLNLQTTRLWAPSLFHDKLSRCPLELFPCLRPSTTSSYLSIMYLQMHGRLECVRLLLRYGARHDICSSAGHTPLHGAAANRHCSVVRSLVEAGASMDVQNNHGNTPLHSAVATGSVDLVSVSAPARCTVGSFSPLIIARFVDQDAY